MKLYTDDYFHIGASHLGSGQPCQDYALSRALEDGSMAYAIVSDGCSTGGRTDVGSRVIAHTAEVAIRDYWKRYGDETITTEWRDINLHQQVLLKSAKGLLGVEQRDLLATCMYAYVTPYGRFVHVRGDGVVALVYASGRIVLRKSEWVHNMPLYPAYFEDNYVAFIRAHSAIDVPFIEEVWEYEPLSGFQLRGVSKHSVTSGIYGSTQRLSYDHAGGEVLKYVVLMSDGVTQIDGVDWKDAVLSLVSFKNTAGSFAKRRMISFIKDAQKKGKGPLDDIAYAVIRVGTDVEENNVA